ncbi:MBL fold metallo-hydrolase [Kitasatospora aburaviensis]
MNDARPGTTHRRGRLLALAALAAGAGRPPGRCATCRRRSDAGRTASTTSGCATRRSTGTASSTTRPPPSPGPRPPPASTGTACAGCCSSARAGCPPARCRPSARPGAAAGRRGRRGHLVRPRVRAGRGRGRPGAARPGLERPLLPSAHVGPKRLHPVPVELEELPQVDAVLISHDHYDHLDMATVKRLVRSQSAPFAVPLGIGSHLRRWGVPEHRIIELDWDETCTLGELAVTLTAAHHFSGRGLTRNTTLWGSWVIAGPTRRVFYTGDSGYFEGYARIGAEHGPFDAALVQIGAYDTAWADIHMTPEDAVRAHRELGAGLLVPVHWCTFNLAPHPGPSRSSGCSRRPSSRPSRSPCRAPASGSTSTTRRSWTAGGRASSDAARAGAAPPRECPAGHGEMRWP